MSTRSKKTCFLVGAGGSCAYKFPSGEKLVSDICDMHFRTSDGTSLVPGTTSETRLKQMQDLLCDSGQYSIDKFIKLNPSFRAEASFAIALQLLRQEHESDVANNKNSEDWLRFVIDKHVESLLREPESEISFVTYNYDRLIEHALWTRLGGHRESCDFEAAFKRIPVVHLHGSLGTYQPQKTIRGFDGPVAIGFGSNRLNEVMESASKLRFFWEPSQEAALLDRARSLLDDCGKLVVIGIGQATQSIAQLLEPFDRAWYDRRTTYVTTCGLTKIEADTLKRSLGPGVVYAEDATAKQILRLKVYA